MGVTPPFLLVLLFLTVLLPPGIDVVLTVRDGCQCSDTKISGDIILGLDGVIQVYISYNNSATEKHPSKQAAQSIFFCAW
jgi:hypothetical protein